MQYYKKIIGMFACTLIMGGILMLLPTPLLSAQRASTNALTDMLPREVRRYKRSLRRDEAQRSRKREENLRLDAQYSRKVQREHLAKQTEQARAMMAQSAQESKELRERGKPWPRTKRMLANSWDHLQKQRMKRKAIRQKNQQQ